MREGTNLLEKHSHVFRVAVHNIIRVKHVKERGHDGCSLRLVELTGPELTSRSSLGDLCEKHTLVAPSPQLLLERVYRDCHGMLFTRRDRNIDRYRDGARGAVEVGKANTQEANK